MRIARVAIDEGSYRPLEIGPLPHGLSVVHGPPGAGKSTLAGLVAETLFGVRFEGSSGDYEALPAGQVEIDSDRGRFRLRRRSGHREAGRFTIANLDGGAATPDTLPALLRGISPETIAKVCFSSDWAGAGRHHELSELLSDEVAREFCRLEKATGRHQATASYDTSTNASHLLARRDEVSREIELRLAERRRTSGELESQLQALAAEAAEVAEKRETIDKALRGVENELAVVESRLRYRAIAEETDRAAHQREAADWRPRLEELEGQIEQWRSTLAELEQREAEVRSELTIIHPDDAEPSLTLADQRAGIAVARRLVEDLESEVARLARSSASEICVCRDAHPRLNPLVDTLGRQLGRLAELSEQQEQALHVQSLQAEAAHLARSQDDLRKQIDHLLGRRQTLWRTTRARADEHVGESTSQFGADYEAACSDEGVTSEHRLQLDGRRRELADEIAELDQRQEQIEAERQRLSYQRSNLLSDATLDAYQTELHELQARIQTGAAVTEPAIGNATLGRLRASEWFTKLTDGRFSGLRLVDGGRRLVVTGSAGDERSSESLSSADRQLAALSLRLALVGGLAHHGVNLPLVLDDPFVGLDDRQAAILANVLDDFSRLPSRNGMNRERTHQQEGVQLLVFTNNRSAIERFKALGAPLLPVLRSCTTTKVPTPVLSRRIEAEPAPVEPKIATPAPRVEMATRTTVKASEYLLSPEEPIERFPVPIADRTGVFARSRIRTIDDLLSADPSAVAEELDRDDVTAELVALWQTHLTLVCFVPEMTFDDASLLTSISVYSPEELSELDAGEFESRVAELLASDRGERYRRRGYTLTGLDWSGWRSRAKRGVENWRETDSWARSQRHRGERRQRASAGRPSRGRNASRTQALRVHSVERDDPAVARRSQSTKNGAQRNGATQTAKSRREWRFYLETTSPVVDAPSIGPKTAKRVQKAGVKTVAELLAADAEELADKIANPRITAETIVAWQHQAGLVCRIPQIRGHDAQLLVACGFTQPEEIASMKPAELLEFIEPFSETTEGQKILRNGKEPDLAEVTDWINWARHSRMLGAA